CSSMCRRSRPRKRPRTEDVVDPMGAVMADDRVEGRGDLFMFWLRTSFGRGADRKRRGGVWRPLPSAGGRSRVIDTASIYIAHPPPRAAMVHADNLVHPDLNRDRAEDYEHAVVSYAGEAVKDLHYAPHSHRRVQLFHIVSGSVTVATDHGSFVVPPERALWIPSNVSHAVTYLQHSSLRYLFF